MRFQELTDRQWDFIRSPLPPTAYTGRPRADNRMTVNGILYVLMSGCRWIDMPSRYGSPKTVWKRHKKGSEKGIWKRILDSLVSHGYHMGLVKVDDLSVDSSTVSAKKGRGRRLAMTATRRRKEAKYMLCSDAPTSLPITIDLGPGDEHESRRLFPLLRNVRIRGTRRPRNRPKCVYADNKYRTPLVMYLTGRGILQLASRNE